MKRFLISLKNYYTRVLQSIAFYPILISGTFIILTFLMLHLESSKIAITLKEQLSFLLIKDIETVRTMLSTLIGGIFSLTVFSFSMVMVVLSQSSSNFSPRLLPGLISNKKNQVILGTYIGTLLYSLITLMNVATYDAIENSVGLTVILGVFFGVSCTGMFVYFIHTISQDIQIQNVIERINKETLSDLEKELKNQKKNQEAIEISFKDEIYYLEANKTGYYKGFSNSLFKDIVEDSNVTIEVLPVNDTYVYKGEQILKYNKKLPEKQTERLNNLLYIATNMHSTNDYFSNMIKLMEVAVRAMSPGVNDPGTAINAIHKLGVIICKVFQLKENNHLQHNKAVIKYRKVSYKNIIKSVFQPIRQYAKEDYNVTKTLINTLNNVYNSNHTQLDSKIVIKKELDALYKDAGNGIFNEDDYKDIISIG